MKYQYDQKTGELLAELDADYDAAFLTSKEPPKLDENEVAVFIGKDGVIPRLSKDGAWKIVPDFRGVKYWTDHNTSHVISELNENVPDDAFLEQPALPLDEYIEQRCKAVERKANEYHALIAGTVDQQKADRFKINIAQAQAIKAGTASQNIIDAMQLQLDANKASGAMSADKSLSDFCDWLIGLNAKADEGALLIESVRVAAKAAIRASKSKAEVDAAEQVALTQAQTKFDELMGGSNG